MTKDKTIEVLKSIKQQYVDCIKIANSPSATDYHKESLYSSLEAVQALDIALMTIDKVGLAYAHK